MADVELRRSNTHCTTGALCKPPSNLAGMSPKLIAPVSPNCANSAPEVPAAADVMNGAFNCQHSRIDPLCAFAEMAVMLSVWGVGAIIADTVVCTNDCNWTRMVSKAKSMVNGRMIEMPIGF